MKHTIFSASRQMLLDAPVYVNVVSRHRGGRDHLVHLSREERDEKGRLYNVLYRINVHPKGYARADQHQ
jgi:hypothetical protein